jgi:hypothetical protein
LDYQKPIAGRGEAQAVKPATAAAPAKIQRQEAKSDKVRFESWLTTENYDYLCKLARAEECSMSSLMNRILRQMRQGEQ